MRRDQLGESSASDRRRSSSPNFASDSCGDRERSGGGARVDVQHNRAGGGDGELCDSRYRRVACATFRRSLRRRPSHMPFEAGLFLANYFLPLVTNKFAPLLISHISSIFFFSPHGFWSAYWLTPSTVDRRLMRGRNSERASLK